MTPEQRKAYNQQYYSKNKKTILTKILQKETCTECGKNVAHQNMKQHQRLSGCKRKINERALKTEIKPAPLYLINLYFKTYHANQSHSKQVH